MLCWNYSKSLKVLVHLKVRRERTKDVICICQRMVYGNTRNCITHINIYAKTVDNVETSLKTHHVPHKLSNDKF